MKTGSQVVSDKLMSEFSYGKPPKLLCVCQYLLYRTFLKVDNAGGSRVANQDFTNDAGNVDVSKSNPHFLLRKH